MGQRDVWVVGVVAESTVQARSRWSFTEKRYKGRACSRDKREIGAPKAAEAVDFSLYVD